MTEEQRKLIEANEAFAEKMLARMEEKAAAGYTGWDYPAFGSCDVPRKMHEKAASVCLFGETSDPKDLVDIANYAMMLHYRLKKIQG